MRKITSPQNPYIKSLVLLKEKAKARKETGTFLIEGKKEISLAIQGGYTIDTILFYPKICSEYQVSKFSAGVRLIEINKDVFEKIAYRGTTEGVIAVARVKILNLTNLKLNTTPLILVAEGIEKPGNIGALLRTADAANIDAVIITNDSTDLYNPNVVRSSVGCVFTNQIAVSNAEEAISFLQENKVSIYCGTLQNKNLYSEQNFTTPTAFVVGNESTGLSDAWDDPDFKHIIIPMEGEIDSMNVSVSAAVLIFEAKRQRGIKA